MDQSYKLHCLKFSSFFYQITFYLTILQKLDRRQRRQLPNEKALYPLCFELMSSSDEEDDEGIRRKLNFIADDTQDHISEVSLNGIVRVVCFKLSREDSIL